MPTVLIADDDVAVRQVLRVTLESEEYTIVEATDGHQAWAHLCHHQPAIAVLDVLMPGHTGLALARAIKADPRLAATMVILLTALRTESDVTAGLAAGADHYLTKPFSPLQLRTLVEHALTSPQSRVPAAPDLPAALA